VEKNLRFWGVRGSFPAGHSKIASHTSCVELEINPDHSVFFDLGTGIHRATRDRTFKKVTVCLSHFHWDHIQGLPFMNGLYESAPEIEIVSGFGDALERLSVLFDERFHPVPADFLKERIRFRFLETGQAYDLGEGLRVSLAPLNHPGISFAFRVQGEMSNLVYATDSDYEPVTVESEKLLRQAENVIMDSQFLVGDSLMKAHYGHSSFKHTIDVAARLRIRHCLLFHFDPQYSDEELFLLEAQAQDYVRETYGTEGPKVILAREDVPLKVTL